SSMTRLLQAGVLGSAGDLHLQCPSIHLSLDLAEHLLLPHGSDDVLLPSPARRYQKEDVKRCCTQLLRQVEDPDELGLVLLGDCEVDLEADPAAEILYPPNRPLEAPLAPAMVVHCCVRSIQANAHP